MPLASLKTRKRSSSSSPAWYWARSRSNFSMSAAMSGSMTPVLGRAMIAVMPRPPCGRRRARAARRRSRASPMRCTISPYSGPMTLSNSSRRRLAYPGARPPVETAIRRSPRRSTDGTAKWQREGSSTAFRSTRSRSASAKIRAFSSASPVAATAKKAPARSPSGWGRAMTVTTAPGVEQRFRPGPGHGPGTEDHAAAAGDFQRDREPERHRYPGDRAFGDTPPPGQVEAALRAARCRPIGPTGRRRERCRVRSRSSRNPGPATD